MPNYEHEMEFNPFSETKWDDFMQRIEHFLPDKETMRKALGSTNARMSQMMRVKATRELSAKLGMPHNIIFHRFKAFRTRGEIKGGKLWMGLDGIPFIKLRPIETAQGVQTQDGSYYEQGAFITRRKTGRNLLAVFKRTGKGRLPVTVPRVDIYDPCLLWLRQQISQPWFTQKFFERLEKEIKWRTTRT